ncbi:phosphoadenosine phosphosulfate reductase [Enterobacter ludwigii]|uniref:phosphoadenosine phosphosulfate reductase n=1 Tax=Enterobacter ludwigii TaxID=299767 RepID=UPI003976991C
MSSKKIPLNMNVLEAARERIEWAFKTFPSVCLSFSGGKDSTVLFHITANIARKLNKKFSVLFIDWEVQFQHTINHVMNMQRLYRDSISHFYWIALPLTTVSGVSQYQPEWISWEKGIKWIRKPPKFSITEYDYFPFYHYAMTFEEFVPAFSAWLSADTGMITLTGMRADESLKRFTSIISVTKKRYSSDKPWTTVARTGNYCTASPLYDWKAQDIWIFHARYSLPYNPLYDLMYRAGVSVRQMRVCEPFGPEQRQGLWLYHVLEPTTWWLVCSRVSGANSGALYGNQSGAFYSKNITLSKPENMTWCDYAYFLLDSMPERTAEHYRTKIAIYLKWYSDRGENVPDEQDHDLGSKDIPSWRRICKTIIKNDYWCRTLSFSPNKPSNYTRYMKRMKERRYKWNLI